MCAVLSLAYVKLLTPFLHPYRLISFNLYDDGMQGCSLGELFHLFALRVCFDLPDGFCPLRFGFLFGSCLGQVFQF